VLSCRGGQHRGVASPRGGPMVTIVGGGGPNPKHSQKTQARADPGGGQARGSGPRENVSSPNLIDEFAWRDGFG